MSISRSANPITRAIDGGSRKAPKKLSGRDDSPSARLCAPVLHIETVIFYLYPWAANPVSLCPCRFLILDRYNFCGHELYFLLERCEKPPAYHVIRRKMLPVSPSITPSAAFQPAMEQQCTTVRDTSLENFVGVGLKFLCQTGCFLRSL